MSKLCNSDMKCSGRQTTLNEAPSLSPLSVQILVSHALGDAFSPFLVGVLADWVRAAIAPHGGGDAAVSSGTSGGVVPYSARAFARDDTVTTSQLVYAPTN